MCFIYKLFKPKFCCARMYANAVSLKKFITEGNELLFYDYCTL